MLLISIYQAGNLTSDPIQNYRYQKKQYRGWLAMFSGGLLAVFHR